MIESMSRMSVPRFTYDLSSCVSRFMYSPLILMGSFSVSAFLQSFPFEENNKPCRVMEFLVSPRYIASGMEGIVS